MTPSRVPISATTREPLDHLGLRWPKRACTVQDMDTTEVIADLATDPETTVNELAASALMWDFDPLDVLALI